MMNETIMDGVWIINVGHEVGKSNPLYVILGILFGVLAAMLIFAIINEVGLSLDLDITNDINSMGKLLILLVIIGGMTGGLIGEILSKRVSIGDTTYDVLIGDNVSFNEFNKRYEIISQNGNIYTVKEKIK